MRKSPRPLARLGSLLLLATLSIASVACGGRQGPTVRFVTASAAEIENQAGEKEVWYEVRPGDELPVHFLFAGVANGMNEMPLVLKAQKTFYLVSRKGGDFFFSFDGQTVATDAGKFAITLIPGPPSNRAGLMIYIGTPGDMKATMDALEAKK